MSSTCVFAFVSSFVCAFVFDWSQLLFLANGGKDASVSFPRVVVKAAEDSHLSFTQGYVSQGGVCLANGLTRILVGDRANVVSLWSALKGCSVEKSFCEHLCDGSTTKRVKMDQGFGELVRLCYTHVHEAFCWVLSA